MENVTFVSNKIRVTVIFIVLFGAVALSIGSMGEQPGRIWLIYLINFLFWTGIAQSGIIFSAILEITNATWGRQVRTVAESTIYFLPASLILLVIMLLGSGFIFPWSAEVILPEAKRAYLNIPFLFIRNILGLTAMTIVSFVFVKRRRAADENSIQGERPRPLSVALLLLYALTYTIVAFDFVMSLSPHWYSTIMGMHFFISCFYAGLAILLVAAALGKLRLFPMDFMSKSDFHDLGKVAFGTSIFWMSFLWSQFLVIWYGNIPEETHFLYLRFFEQPWETVTWLVLALSFFAPFILLINKKVKTSSITSGLVGVLIFSGLFLHMYVLVAPSLSPHHFYFGPLEWCLTLGYLGIFMLCQEYGIRKIVSKQLDAIH